MKVVLVHPALSTDVRYGKLKKVGPTQEPLGIAYIAAVLLKDGHDVSIIDAEALKLTDQEVVTEIRKTKPDLIGYSMTTPGFFCTMQSIARTHKAFPKIKIIVGGPHVTVLPKETMAHKEIYCGVMGEGELTAVELVKAIEKNEPIDKIQGIVFRKGKKVIINPRREFIKDIDSIPKPARHLLPMHIYKPAPTYYKRLPNYAVIGARGCPFRCTFCGSHFGKMYRHHSVQRIVDEVEELVYKYGAKEILFRDDSFTVNRKHIIALCNELIARGLHKKILWSSETRVHLVDKELLQKMFDAGCWEMHYGIESGSQRLLDLMQKDITLEQTRHAVKIAHEVGMAVKGFFMLGLPTETREESLQTIQFAIDLDVDWAQFTLTTPYPGTVLYDQCKKNGLLRTYDWRSYKTWAGFTDVELPFVTKGRTSQELKDLQRTALKRFYFRPVFIFKKVAELKSMDALKANIDGAMALLK